VHACCLFCSNNKGAAPDDRTHRTAVFGAVVSKIASGEGPERPVDPSFSSRFAVCAARGWIRSRASPSVSFPLFFGCAPCIAAAHAGLLAAAAPTQGRRPPPALLPPRHSRPPPSFVRSFGTSSTVCARASATAFVVPPSLAQHPQTIVAVVHGNASRLFHRALARTRPLHRHFLRAHPSRFVLRRCRFRERNTTRGSDVVSLDSKVSTGKPVDIISIDTYTAIVIAQPVCSKS